VPPLRGRRVVVTGLGAVSPNGIGVRAFWEATRSGKSGVSPIVEFDVSDLPIRIAGRVDGFDASRFLPTKELRHVPRVTTLGLAASTEALAGAGLVPERLALEDLRNFAVVVGSGGVGWEFTERQFREYYFGNPKAVSLYTIPASTPGSISSEISMHFGLRGPSHVVSTGCTSSSDALGHAFSLIRYGRARWALAGGTDAPLSPGILRGFCLMRILTPSWNDEPQRASRPFSRDRDGFVLAEGAWMLVLEELGSALERGATIHAELAGYGATCEAFHRVRLSEDGEEPARAMRLALEDAGLAPEDIDYVNFHGTSTELNDRIETRAVKQVFGRRATMLPGSSLKSMIGHPQGACGAAGSVASLLAMRDGFAPPTINRDVDDPECDLDVVPHVGRPHEIGALLCNCIGFGSKNAALVFTRVERDGG
jgi:3-oxoacyl-[acyl-carrier-protein] synthase II